MKRQTYPMTGRSTVRKVLATAAFACAALTTSVPAQQWRLLTPRSPFDLMATRDYAVTGMRTAADYRFFVSNAGFMDVQQGVEGLIPAQIRKSGVFNSFATEIGIWAMAGRTDYAANRARVPSLANIRNAASGGHTISINHHIVPSATDWLPTDGSLGIHFSGARTPTPAQANALPACQNHSKDLIPAGVTLMAGSDCPSTWGVSGYQGRGNVSSATYLQGLRQQGNAFVFDFWKFPASTGFIGNNFQTYGFASDFNISNNADYGNVVPGGSGAPRSDGYPLALEWQFETFNFKETRFAGVVFYQATVTNRSRERYGAALDFDSLFAGFVVRPTAAMARAGFWPENGAVVFNDLRSRADCDQARALPERLVITNFVGTCSSIDVSRGFTRGAMALVVLKSPIGDLRNKQFSNPLSPFSAPGHPLAGDTITFNIGRSCGSECTTSRVLANRAQSAFGVLASREVEALAGDQPTSLPPNDYWFLFHPANGAAHGDGPRVDATQPRAGGGFNYCVPGPGAVGGKPWTYRSNRPAAAPLAPDTLWLDDCNPITNQLVPMWHDTFPDRSLKLIRGSEYVGAGPFRLPAGETVSFVVALVLAPDSISIQNGVRDAVDLYQNFFAAPQPPPLPRVAAVDVIGGSVQQTFVRITLDPTALRYTDDFLVAQAQLYRTAPPSTPEGRLARLNPWLDDSLEARARNNIARILVYKSCNPNATTLQYTAARNINGICTIDEIRDTLNVSRGPVAYASILRPDTVTLYTDGNIVAGQSYLYAFAAETYGARWMVVDSTAAGFITRTLTFVDKVVELPRSKSASNVVTVYVPASQQAGGSKPQVQFREEKFGLTIDTVRLVQQPFVVVSYNATSIETMGPLDRDRSFRVLFGERALIDEYRRTGSLTLDSMRIRLVRTRTSNFTITGTGLTARATPVRENLDTLFFRSQAAIPVRVVGSFDSTRVSVGATTITTRTIPTPTGVLIDDDSKLPLFASNVFTGVNFTPQTYPGSTNYVPIRVSIDTTSITNTTTKGLLSTIRFDDRGQRVAANLAVGPLSLDFLGTPSRPTGAGTGGEYIIAMVDEEFGNPNTYRIDQGLQAVQAALGAAITGRTVGSTGVTDAASAALIGRFLNRVVTPDSLIPIKVPFTVANKSFGRAVRVAMLKSDKSAGYLLGTGADTLRIPVPQDQWLPGDRLIFIEDVPVGASTQPVVSFYPAVIGCGSGLCNPVTGPGGDANYGATPPGFEIHPRYVITARSPRELAFTMTATRAGATVQSVTQAQLDSVNVVPNPYIVFSAFEQQSDNERLLFTHLPPSGMIEIFTVSGQFVQRLKWTEQELAGNGDLYFDMRTREGTKMGSGLYLFVVSTTSPDGRALKKLGRFIIVR